MRRYTLLLLAATAGAVACSDQSTAPNTGTPSFGKSSAENKYVIIGAGNTLPADLAARVAALGGTLVKKHDAIGVAVATGGADFASRASGITGVESVARDHSYEQPQPPRIVDLTEGQVAGNPNTNTLYPIQWAPGAIGAPAAWAAGYRGAGVRVAILDGGLYTAHPDLAGQIDVARSKSFACVPLPLPSMDCTPTAFNDDVGTFWHGTHVAGIVAAADNNTGVIGIAPGATLIGVKVLHNGSGEFSWLIDAIMYASTPIAEGGAGAQVINMSLGALIDMSDPLNTKKDVKELDKAISRAADYATKRGTILIGAAGNDATKLGKQFINLPSMSKGVIAVAATAPEAWAYGGNDPAHPLALTFWRQASYTNFGKKGVDLAAPGGDFSYPGNENCAVLVTRPCWVFDLYLSTSRAGYSWAAGTSMASPVVAGVAALIIGKYHGNISPAQVKAKLEQGAIDYGKPGNDDVYGKGWVNAFNSVN